MRCQLALVGMLMSAYLTTVSHADEATADSADSYVKAWAASFINNDPEKMMAFYDRSKGTEVIMSSGLLFRGYDAIKETYYDAQKEVRFLKSATKNMQTRIFGDTALITLEHLFETQLLADGSRWRGHVHTTSVLHWKDREWTIVLEHSSPIRGVDRVSRIED